MKRHYFPNIGVISHTLTADIKKTLDEQPQSEVEYAKELQEFWRKTKGVDEGCEISYYTYSKIARHFYELGLKSK
jgi:hypothetical protein